MNKDLEIAETFAKPAVDTTLTVVTRWKDSWYWATSPFKDTKRTGKVVASEPYDLPNTFRFVDEDGVHVIALSHVLTLSCGTVSASRDEVKTWQVQGSKGNKYTVTLVNGLYHCTCPGFGFRRQCKHLNSVK